MAIIGKVCKIGVWDETVPGISFDENGMSNYAKLYNRLTEAYPRGETGKNEWNNIINKIKNTNKKQKYNCIIGVSGGTDSCYLLHLAKNVGLKPLAVHLDNGWDTEIAVSNIERMTKQLDIDLKTYVIDYSEIKDLLKSYMYAGLPWIDLPTDIAIKAILYKIASNEGIKYILRGNDFRTEGSQPNEWTYGDGRQLIDVHEKFGKVKLKTFPNYTVGKLLYYGLIKKIKSIYPFYYIDYNKTDAKKILMKEYGWQDYGGHHHENIFTKFAITYWLTEKFGIDKRKITFSALIMNGEMKRDEALNALNELPYAKDQLKSNIDYILKKLDLTQNEFDSIFKNPNHTYKDYKSYEFIIDKFIKYSAPILRLIFIHKPQSLFQKEMRKNTQK
jgi:N-acetyl sugar amidotransferase